jgi:SRSO17 transposase
MAALLDSENTQPMRQSLHHLVAKAPWSDEVLLEQVRNHVLPAMQKQGPVVAWIVDDTGFPKKGKHSVGVTRQYCGQVGKQENCRVAVSLSVATWNSSLPIAYRLYLPKEWAEDAERREKTEVPEEVEFQTKPAIALDQIRAAVAAKLDRGVVLADAAYGINTEFRDGLTELKLQYVVGVQSSMTVWEPGKQPLPAKPRGRMGRPPRLLQRSTEHQPVSVKQSGHPPRSGWLDELGRLKGGGSRRRALRALLADSKLSDCSIRRFLLADVCADLFQFEPDGGYRVTAGPEMFA